MRRELPQLVAFLAGLGMVIAFFVPTEFFKGLEGVFTNWTSIIAGFSSVLALTSLVIIHGEKISRQEEETPYSVVLLLVLFVTTLSGVFYGVEPVSPEYVVIESPDDVRALVSAADEYAAIATAGTAAREAKLAGLAGTAGRILGTRRLATLHANLEALAAAIKENRAAKRPDLPPRPAGDAYAGKVVVKVDYYNLFQWLYEYVYTPLQSTMFSILAFYVASAAYRAFRARTLEGTLLLVAAFLVMIGRVSLGYVLNRWSGWLPFPAIADWIMSVLNSAGQRAIMIGAALGIVSASLRMLLGLEQTYLGGE
jgi:hypothetical protein